jgi:phosphomannomutase
MNIVSVSLSDQNLSDLKAVKNGLGLSNSSEVVRASNTQPDLVLRFEAATMERVEEIKAYVLGKLAEFGDVKIGGH